MKILLVDDDAMITELLAIKLQEKGHAVEKAYGGWDALNRITNHSYDLLITDLMMPDISGLTLISLLRNYVYGTLPIIIISSLDQSSIVLSGMGLGAEDYFIKPIDMEKLIHRVERLASTQA